MTTLDEDLTALPELYDACDVVLGRLPRQPRVRGGLPRGLHLRQDALDVRSRVLAVLSSWCGLVIAEQGGRPALARRVPELAAFLIEQRRWLAIHPAGEDFAAEVRELASECRRTIEHGDAQRRVLGRCRQDGCGRQVWAVLRMGTKPHVLCDNGHEWQRQDWLLLADVC
jgi:hypothetical protein